MAFIRDREQELTGYQEQEPWSPEIDVNVDFVMVYGNDPSLYDRIAAYRARGYQVHLMTGAAWGNYQDYLYGRWDGQPHWDEAQTRANGETVGHGVDIPYMVPSVAFSDYLATQLRKAVDAGVVAIHLEEPEFWDFSGYSPAFQREYALHYRQPWVDPRTDLTAYYQAAQLKALLYQRLIRRCAESIKAYSLATTGHPVRMYVPTHSLINYSAWKIMSPEGLLNEIADLDGFIAQVWTGTSREPNYYRGVLKERTFETAYCEFSMMQELVKGSDKQMWFLADPIEDNPRYGWPDYQASYFETITASLLHPQVHHYEVCPWPHRVFQGEYPQHAPGVTPQAMPDTYRTQLNNMFQTLGNMAQPDHAYAENNDLRVGVAMSDTALYQRSYPDPAAINGNPLTPELMDFYTSTAFPMFYGLALPLVKHGLPIRCVQLDNVQRTANYLADLDYLVLSYDFMKPQSPAVNSEIAAWVRGGGTLLYVGAGNDPYNALPAWWNDGGQTQATPLAHLLKQLGLKTPQAARVGTGAVDFLLTNPADIGLDEFVEGEYLDHLETAIAAKGGHWTQTNALVLQRGPYLVAAVMGETTNAPHAFAGHYIDLQTPGFDYCPAVTLAPGANALLYDLDRLPDARPTIIGTTARVLRLEQDAEAVTLTVKTTAGVASALCLAHVPATAVQVQDAQGRALPAQLVVIPYADARVVQFTGDGGVLTLTLTSLDK